MMRCSTLTRHLLALSGLWLASAATGLAPIADGDIFWHLAGGREMWRSGQLLTHDLFSVGAAGRPWTDVHWLFQFCAYVTHAWLGLRGLVLAKCALIGTAACLFVWGTRKHARLLTGLSMIAVLLCARHLLLMRPVIVSLVMLGFFCAELERFRQHKGRLWLLPLAQVVWSNCQGLSVLGPVIVAAYCVGAIAQHYFAGRMSYPFAPETDVYDLRARRKHLRTLLACLGACSLASFITPFGAAALSLPGRLLARIAPFDSNPFRHVVENVPTFAAERSATGDFWHLKWFIGLLAFSLAARRARIALSELIVLIGFTTLAVMSNRNVLLLYVVATPIAVRQLMPALRWCRYQLRNVCHPRLTIGLAGVAFVLLSCVVASAAAREPRLDEPTPFHFPIASAAAIAAHGGEGTVFSADHYGGYLIWSLYPRFRPYFDTRWLLRSAQEFNDYLALIDEPDRFDAFAQQHPVSYVALPVAYPTRYLPLIAHLYRSGCWRLIFTNGSEVLFANRALVEAQSWDLGSDATTDSILRRAVHDFDRPELQSAARMHLAMLEIAVGEYAQAERAMLTLTTPSARALLAQVRLLAGDLVGAERLAERLLDEGEDDLHSLTLLANVSVRRQELPKALGYLARAVALDPFDLEATRLLRLLEERTDAH